MALRIALSKGRIFDDTVPLLAAADIHPVESPGSSRKLIVPSTNGEVEFLIVRASDVATYVQHGGADLGVVGKDVLLEHGGEGLIEPLDLGIACCKLMVCGPKNLDLTHNSRIRIATKYTQCARAHFAATGRQVEIIKLYGSMELAPLTGLADAIVDVVDTGNTLRANGLEALELVADSSARLVVNRVAMKISHDTISPIIERMRAAVAAR